MHSGEDYEENEIWDPNTSESLDPKRSAIILSKPSHNST